MHKKLVQFLPVARCTSFTIVWIKNVWVRVMVFNATLEETRVPVENHRPAASHCQTLSHNAVLSTPRNDQDSNLPL